MPTMRTPTLNLIFDRAILLVFLAVFLWSPAHAAGEKIYFVKAEGIINPIMAEYLTKGIRNAEAEKAAALVIQLDTPGGLDLSMREIVKAMLSSEVPVVVYVAP